MLEEHFLDLLQSPKGPVGIWLPVEDFSGSWQKWQIPFLRSSSGTSPCCSYSLPIQWGTLSIQLPYCCHTEWCRIPLPHSGILSQDDCPNLTWLWYPVGLAFSPRWLSVTHGWRQLLLNRLLLAWKQQHNATFWMGENCSLHLPTRVSVLTRLILLVMVMPTLWAL